MAPEAKTAGKAGSPHKEDTPEVKGPQSVLSEREKEVILHSIMTVKGFPAVSSSSCRPHSFHLFNEACFDLSLRSGR